MPRISISSCLRFLRVWDVGIVARKRERNRIGLRVVEAGGAGGEEMVVVEAVCVDKRRTINQRQGPGEGSGAVLLS